MAISGLVYLRLHGAAVLERRMEGWLAAHGWRARVARILLGFSRGVQTIRTWGDVFAAVFYVADLHWSLVVACYFLVIKSFGGQLGTLTFADAMLVLVFTMVGSAVQLPGVGGGSQALSISRLRTCMEWGRKPRWPQPWFLAGYVCIVFFRGRAAPAERRILAGRIAKDARTRNGRNRRGNTGRSGRVPS